MVARQTLSSLSPEAYAKGLSESLQDSFLGHLLNAFTQHSVSGESLKDSLILPGDRGSGQLVPVRADFRAKLCF